MNVVEDINSFQSPAWGNQDCVRSGPCPEPACCNGLALRGHAPGAHGLDGRAPSTRVRGVPGALARTAPALNRLGLGRGRAVRDGPATTVAACCRSGSHGPNCGGTTLPDTFLCSRFKGVQCLQQMPLFASGRFSICELIEKRVLNLLHIVNCKVSGPFLQVT